MEPDRIETGRAGKLIVGFLTLGFVTMNLTHTTLIFECANSHGGDVSALRSLIYACSDIIYADGHIKFQIIDPDRTALPDFHWYTTYKKLHLKPEQWREIISESAGRFSGVWLDVFDRYGIEVLTENLENIFGIKLQASVLENTEILTALKDERLSGQLSLIVNVSGHGIDAVREIARSFSGLGFRETILQVGHQAYPTRPEDTGLQKLSLLRAVFPELRLSLADHAPAEDSFAQIAPLLGILAGCSVIEKHVCLSRASAEYDHQSALEPAEMQVLAEQMQLCDEMLAQDFVSTSESEYLEKSVQTPVTARRLPAGSLVGSSDIVYRRTAQRGAAWKTIREEQRQRRVLARNIEERTTIQLADLRPARIGVLVACRLKSSRLKDKALLSIGGRTSVERCLESCLGIREADLVVLATSTLDQDAPLADYTLNGQVKFWRGDAEDVIRRYVDACDALDIDIVIRVTADCPVVSAEIATLLLEKHFSSGADYTAYMDCAVGTGCEIYNTEALRRVLSFIGYAKYSEYMTWYMKNNSDIFKVEEYALPPDLVRGYRLTLDYAEDLEMLRQLYEELERRGRQPDLASVFEVLDERPDIAKVNAHIGLRYRTDQALIETLDRETKIQI